MKIAPLKSFLQLKAVISISLCLVISAVSTYLFLTKGYCFSFLLGFATGLGTTTAIWLIYGLKRGAKSLITQ